MQPPSQPMHSLPDSPAAVGKPGGIAPAGNPTWEENAAENRLIQARLGVASSLFTALRCKHADTASHSLRVTLCTASWAMAMGMSEDQRDVMEVAALLHDIGKIAVPDNVLLKPGPLTREEMAVMNLHRRTGVQNLQSSCTSADVLEIVAASGDWYDG